MEDVTGGMSPFKILMFSNRMLTKERWTSHIL